MSVNYKEYATKKSRLDSFKDWPKALKQRPEELVESGFFYEGVGDRTICFYCGIGIKDWDPEDTPNDEHLKFNKYCIYLRLKLGKPQIKDDDMLNVEISLNEKEKVDSKINLCRICYENPLQITFMPCGHIFTCIDCGCSLKDCPVCRIYIHTNFRIYLP